MFRSFLVVGAGMVGSYVAAELCRQGADVTLLDVHPLPHYVKAIAGPGAKLRRGDILRLADLVEAMLSVRADCVIHTAALLGDSVSRDPFGGFDVNVNGTINVLEAARLTHVRRVVYASTAGVYDREHPDPIREDHPLGPVEMYAATKLAAEQVGMQYAHVRGVEFVIVRYAVIYGPAFSAGGSLYGRVTREMVLGPLAGRQVTIERSGRFLQPVEFFHVRDAACGTVLAATKDDLEHQVFNIGSGRLSDLSDLAAAVREVLPAADITIQGAPEQPRRFPFNLTRARAELGYVPSYGLVEGIGEYIEKARQIPGLIPAN